MITELFISWAPMILLIGVWIYFMRRSGAMKQGNYLDNVKEYMSEHLAETRRLNANLERIAGILESQNTGANANEK
ncbi:MAG: hypothetical protein V4631_11225 [Pseudomonadota bacterium]